MKWSGLSLFEASSTLLRLVTSLWQSCAAPPHTTALVRMDPRSDGLISENSAATVSASALSRKVLSACRPSWYRR